LVVIFDDLKINKRILRPPQTLDGYTTWILWHETTIPCDGPRTSQGQGITCCIRRGCALTPPRNGEAPSIRDAKFAWYKKGEFFAEE
jgi:hypothetical protein